MKKLLSLTILVFSVFTFFGISNATSACKTITFPDGSVCLNISKNGSTYTLNRTINCPSGSCSLSCNILLPNNTTLNGIGACNGSFNWSKRDIETVKIYVNFNNNNQKQLTASYNFNIGQWSDIPTINETELTKFSLSTNRSESTTNQRTNLTIKALNSNNNILTNYTNKIKFRVYYRSSVNSNWINAPSSSYTIASNYTNGYRFLSSDNGNKTLNDFIRFNTNNRHYKVEVYDENNPSIYNEIVFYVGNTSTNNYNLDNFFLSTNRSEPTTSQRANLTIRARNSNNNTITNFNERVKFEVYYRSSSSSSWTRTTSSTYYTINSDYSNGYYFSTSDNGVKTIPNLIKFNRNNYDYKLRVYSDNNSSIYNEIIFYVGNTNSSNNTVDGFTVKEFEMIGRIYNLWPILINQLKTEYPRFKTDTTWISRGNDLYKNMKDVLDDKNGRKFTNYNKFFTDFERWYSRTINTIH